MKEGDQCEMVWQIIYKYLIGHLICPNIFLMFYSFNSGGNMIHFEHFTFEHYQSLFKMTNSWQLFLIQ